VGAAGWLLFSIILIWQLPHFYAISLYRSRDYSAAGFPMLADRIGVEATRVRIVAWTVVLLPLTLAGPWLTQLGAPYAVAAALLGAWFLWTAIRLYRERDDDAARRYFRVSLAYLAGLFLAMLVDVLWTGLAA
jgi:protoheme IX farnesyltransferase